MKHTFFFILLSSACYPLETAPSLAGVPVDANQLQQVFDFYNVNAPITFNVTSDAPLAYLTNLDFVSAPFPCLFVDDSSGATCLGETFPALVQIDVQVAMVQDIDGDPPATADVRCTALAHELGHVTSGTLTGDFDGNHENPNVWGPTGLVQQALDALCPGMPPRPQNLDVKRN